MLLLSPPLLLKLRLNILLLKSIILFFSASHCSQFQVFSIRCTKYTCSSEIEHVDHKIVKNFISHSFIGFNLYVRHMEYLLNNFEIMSFFNTYRLPFANEMYTSFHI